MSASPAILHSATAYHSNQTRSRRRPFSQRRIEANRRNALRSSGPRTPEGKARVASNAIKHGFFAGTARWTLEQHRDFRELHEQLRGELKPLGRLEEYLIAEMALASVKTAMMLRYVLDRRSGQKREAVVHEVSPRPLLTVGIGMVGGLLVGMTSVGSGSLMIVLLLFLYPMIGANQLVGTDLTQAVPLTLAAALGALAFGHVEFSVTTSIVIGSVPAVLIGSFFSSRAPDRFVRPAITFVIFASGLKYVGLGTTTLGWVLCAVLLAAGAAWLAYARPWRNGTSGSKGSAESSTSNDESSTSNDESSTSGTGTGTEDPLAAGPQAPA